MVNSLDAECWPVTELIVGRSVAVMVDGGAVAVGDSGVGVVVVVVTVKSMNRN